MSVEVKWENFMIAHKNRELQKTVSVENLLFLDCVPDSVKIYCI